MEPVINLSILMTPGHMQQRQQVLWACAVTSVVSPDHPTLTASFPVSAQQALPPPEKTLVPSCSGTAKALCTWSLRRKAGSLGSGSTSSMRPCSFLVCAWGAGDVVSNLPKALLPRKRGGPVRPCTWRSHPNLSQHPYLLQLQGTPEPEKGRGQEGACGGQVWGILRGQSALQPVPLQRSPWNLPGHFTTNLCFNPLLETMQTLIQKNTSAIRIFVSI